MRRHRSTLALALTLALTLLGCRRHADPRDVPAAAAGPTPAAARPSKGTILIVTSSHRVLGASGLPTGVFLAEVTHPYALLTAAGYAVDLASVAGGEPPIDPKSDPRNPDGIAGWDVISLGFLTQPATVARWRHTRRLADVHARDYAAVLFAGGTGAMFDLPTDPDAGRLARETWELGRPLAAFCHGVAALVDVDLADGTPLVRDRALTAFSSAEEALAAQRMGQPPTIFSPQRPLEARLRERGARFHAAAPFTPFVVVDGSLITGQQPYSAPLLVTELTRALEPDRGPSVWTVADANRALVHQYHVEVWERGDLARAGAYLGPGFVSHAGATLPGGDPTGPELIARFRAAFPDLASREDYVMADGDRVVIGWTITGTHRGELYGQAPTGRRIEISGMDVLRVVDGKFVEHWGGLADQLGDVLAQLQPATTAAPRTKDPRGRQRAR